MKSVSNIKLVDEKDVISKKTKSKKSKEKKDKKDVRKKKKVDYNYIDDRIVKINELTKDKDE